MEYIAFDAHKDYALAPVARPDGQIVREQRLPHERGTLQQFLMRCEPGSPVAVETIGNWYWIVDESEAAGCVPKLVHARKAKLMMGEINKTEVKTSTAPTGFLTGTGGDQRDALAARLRRGRAPDARCNLARPRFPAGARAGGALGQTAF